MVRFSRRQADFREGRVDPFQGLAAADDRGDPAEGLLVPAGRVFAAFLAAVAVDRRPGVEAAVRLAERPDVGGQPVLGEEGVELEEVVVAAAERDLRGDHLRQRLDAHLVNNCSGGISGNGHWCTDYVYR